MKNYIKMQNVWNFRTLKKESFKYIHESILPYKFSSLVIINVLIAVDNQCITGTVYFINHDLIIDYDYHWRLCFKLFFQLVFITKIIYLEDNRNLPKILLFCNSGRQINNEKNSRHWLTTSLFLSLIVLTFKKCQSVVIRFFI